MKKGKDNKNRVRISNGSVNIYGSRVLTSGIDFKQYERNPILLWMHRRGDVGSVVGTVVNLAVEGDDLTGELVFDEIGDTSRMVAEKWRKGTLSMVSANFDILELSDSPEHVVPGQRAHTVTKSKLVEISVVDIGGNDDAVKLKKGGEAISLSSNDDGIKLPLLGNKTSNNFKNMNLKTIALKLGLPETATEQEVLDAISLLLGKETENKTLKEEVDNMRLAGITTMVDEAVAARKIGNDKKAHFIELGKKVGVDSLKLTLDSMSPQMKPTDITGGGVHPGRAAMGEWVKLSDVPADRLMELRNNDKETYMKLYKAEYGVDCVIE